MVCRPLAAHNVHCVDVVRRGSIIGRVSSQSGEQNVCGFALSLRFDLLEVGSERPGQVWPVKQRRYSSERVTPRVEPVETELKPCIVHYMPDSSDRREEFIAANADFFAARNCHISFVPIGFAKTEETRSYLSFHNATTCCSGQRFC